MNGDAGGAPPMATTGFVKRWFGEKGFGFIVPSGSGADADVFVHRRALVGAYDLNEGDVVSFEAEFEERTKKFKARTCSLVEGAAGGGGPPAGGGAAPGGDGGRGKGAGKKQKGLAKGQKGGLNMMGQKGGGFDDDDMGARMGAMRGMGGMPGMPGMGALGDMGGGGGRGGGQMGGMMGGFGDDMGMGMDMGGGGKKGGKGRGDKDGKGGKGGKGNAGGKGGNFGGGDFGGGGMQQMNPMHGGGGDMRGQQEVEPQMQVVAQLPLNWVQLRGPNGTFFVNSATRQVMQDLPQELQQMAAQHMGGGHPGHHQQHQQQQQHPHHMQQQQQQQMQQQMPQMPGQQMPGQMAPQQPQAQQPAAAGQGVTEVKGQIGDWLICEDDQGIFYRDNLTGETYEAPPPELLRLYQQQQQGQQPQGAPQQQQLPPQQHQQQPQQHQQQRMDPQQQMYDQQRGPQMPYPGSYDAQGSF